MLHRGVHHLAHLTKLAACVGGCVQFCGGNLTESLGWPSCSPPQTHHLCVGKVGVGVGMCVRFVEKSGCVKSCAGHLAHLPNLGCSVGGGGGSLLL